MTDELPPEWVEWPDWEQWVEAMTEAADRYQLDALAEHQTMRLPNERG